MSDGLAAAFVTIVDKPVSPSGQPRRGIMRSECKILPVSKPQEARMAKRPIDITVTEVGRDL